MADPAFEMISAIILLPKKIGNYCSRRIGTRCYTWQQGDSFQHHFYNELFTAITKYCKYQFYVRNKVEFKFKESNYSYKGFY